MKFGKRLAEESVAGWRYLDYESLKKLLKDLLSKDGASRHTRNFAQLLKDEVKSVEAFYLDKQNAAFEELNSIEEDLYVLKGWVESDFPDIERHLDKVQRRYTDLGLEIAKLLHFLELNVTAIRKVLKKYDHVTGHHAGPGLLTGSEGATVERLSDPYELSEMVVAIQSGLEKIFFLRKRIVSRSKDRRILAPSRDASESSANESAAEAPQIPIAIKREDLAWARQRVRERQNSEKQVLKFDSSDLAMSWTVKTLEEEEQGMSFESFLAKQLLVSDKALEPLAEEALVQQSRDSRRSQHGRSLRQLRRPSVKNVTFQSEERVWNNLLDEKLTGLSFHVFIVLLLSGLASSNLACLVPFMDVYAEAARVEIDTAALGFAVMFIAGWTSLYSLLNMTKKGVLLPLCLGASALLLGNYVYAQLFSSYFSHDVDDKLRNSDLVFFLAMLLLGTGGFLIAVLPATVCLLPSLALTKKSETVASSLVAALFVGAIFGRGVMTLASSAEFDTSFQFFGLHPNSHSFPTMAFGVAWGIVLILIVGPVACAVFTSPVFGSPGRHEDNSASSVMGLGLFYRDAERPWLGSSFKAKGGISWFAALLIQTSTSFALTVSEALLGVTLNSIFLLSWPAVSLISLLFTMSCLPLLIVAWLSVRTVGSWFVLRVVIALAALVACFLLPLEGLTAGYSMAWFLCLDFVLFATSMVVQSVVCSVVVKNLEGRFHDVPLAHYGKLGPILSVQTARYMGASAAYLFLAFVFNRGAMDPTYVLSSAFSTVALFYTVSFFALLWEDY